ncbi:hypothetical protein HS088_TW11G00874 [Tripterygium wilfordii]|uniref:RING-type domain-containing protein n=1 Tax=Tripterygium wilfordii TaxID=458696 RepID=A0A7J7D370_TRIWF|nr:uncharacterized protein LOC120009408 [Tripterygium wilfordii]KAF5740795.1 hypothetical protein HS088_TW11G00874 [Tripterygium wilfordii]
MGSACCVAARDRSRTLPDRTVGENLHRNVTCSPTWSFRWENRRRVAGEIDDSPSQVSHGISENLGVEMKEALDSERGNVSDEGSPLENMGTPVSLKSEVHEAVVGSSMMTPLSDLSMVSNNSIEVKNLAESPVVADLSASKFSFSIPSPFLMPVGDPFSTRVQLPPNSTPSRRPRRSPGYRLLRQVSDSRILGLKLPNEYAESDGRPSFLHSTCSNDLTTGSHGGSSDGWSMRTFTELVASSQRERWSFDSEHLGSVHGRIGESSGRLSYSPSVELQTCSSCSKLLTERSSWSCNELAVAAVLVCGHVYHAECLETLTQEPNRYDPACPICMVGENQVLKMSRKASRVEADLRAKTHKISRNRVRDSYLDGGFGNIDHQSDEQQVGKAPKMEASSSSRSGFSKPFLKRHFSIGTKWRRSSSENGLTTRKGFWARYRKYLAP